MYTVVHERSKSGNRRNDNALWLCLQKLNALTLFSKILFHSKTGQFGGPILPKISEDIFEGYWGPAPCTMVSLGKLRLSLKDLAEQSRSPLFNALQGEQPSLPSSLQYEIGIQPN